MVESKNKIKSSDIKNMYEELKKQVEEEKKRYEKELDRIENDYERFFGIGDDQFNQIVDDKYVDDIDYNKWQYIHTMERILHNKNKLLKKYNI